MNIRKITEADIDNVSELFIQQALHIKNLDDCYCNNDAYIKREELHEDFKKYLWELFINPDALIIVAEDNSQIIGFIIGVITPCRVPSFISKVNKSDILRNPMLLLLIEEKVFQEILS